MLRSPFATFFLPANFLFAANLFYFLSSQQNECNAYTYEIMTAIGEIDLATDKLPQWAAPRHVDKTLMTLTDETYIHYEPLGVILIIGAWNYPFGLIVTPLIGAIAAGMLLRSLPAVF